MTTPSDMYADLMKTRDEAYDNFEKNPAGAAAAAAADIMLPLDLINTINKAGRGENVTGEDIAMSALDAVSTVAGLFTFGLGKAAGGALKAAVKAPKIIGVTAGTAGVAVGAVAENGRTQPEEPQGKTDGGTDTPSNLMQETPQYNITVNLQPKKISENTDTNGLSDAMLLLALAQIEEQKNSRPAKAEPTRNPAIIPAAIGIGLALIVVILLMSRR